MHSTQARYLVREGMVGLVRRRLSGTVAVLIMGSSLLMLAIFSIVSINLDRILQTVRGDIDVVVYLRDDIHEADQAVLHEDLLSMATRGPSPAENHHEPGRARPPHGVPARPRRQRGKCGRSVL